MNRFPCARRAAGQGWRLFRPAPNVCWCGPTPVRRNPQGSDAEPRWKLAPGRHSGLQRPGLQCAGTWLVGAWRPEKVVYPCAMARPASVGITRTARPYKPGAVARGVSTRDFHQKNGYPSRGLSIPSVYDSEILVATRRQAGVQSRVGRRTRSRHFAGGPGGAPGWADTDEALGSGRPISQRFGHGGRSWLAVIQSSPSRRSGLRVGDPAIRGGGRSLWAGAAQPAPRATTAPPRKKLGVVPGAAGNRPRGGRRRRTPNALARRK